MVRLLQLTDLHIFADRSERLKGVDTAANLEIVVQHVLDSGIEFDHLIMTGDHTHDELAASYQFVKNQFERLADHWWQVPGNHDDRAVLRSVFSNVEGAAAEEIRFHFEAETWSCIGLDSHQPGLVAGRIQPHQIDWLKSRLAETSSEHVALFLHHPPVDIPSDWMDPIGLEGRELLAEVVAANSAIELIVCGHIHHDFRSELHQATVLSSPATSIQFDPRGSSPTFSSDCPGYRLIELSSTGWSTEVVRVPEAAGVVE